MLANRTSRWSIGAVLLCIAMLAASWFLLISPRRADAVAVRGQVTQADSQAASLQLQIATLKAQFADLPKQTADLMAIKKQLPPGADIPDFVRDLQRLAAEAGVSLDSITPSSPLVLGGAAAPKAGPGTLVGVPLSISVSGDYFEAALFVKSLQTRIARSYLITAIAVTGKATDTTTATPTSQVTPSAMSTVTPTPVATPTASATPTNPLATVTLAINGSVYVLLDETSTLDDVAKAVKAIGTDKTPGASVATATSQPTSTAPAN